MTHLIPQPITYFFEQPHRTRKGEYRRGFRVDYYQDRRCTVWSAHRLPRQMEEASRWSVLDERLPLGVHALALGDREAAVKLSDLVQEISGPEWVWKLLVGDEDWWASIERLLMRSEQEELREQRRLAAKMPAHLPHTGNPFVT